MINTAKETICTNCVHRSVCSKMMEFLEAQKATDSLVLADDADRITYVKSLQWLRIELKCLHYLPESVKRGENR